MRTLSTICVAVVFLMGCSSSTPPDDAGTDAMADTGVDTGLLDSGGPCPGGQPMCGSVCCSNGAVCINDGTGNLTCAATCMTSSECPSAKSCCTVVQGLTGKGACLAMGIANGQQCRCTTGMECANGCCAPSTNASGAPEKPYVCKPADGNAYDCCQNGVTCNGGSCCLTILGTGSKVCESPCQLASDCPGSTCQPLSQGMCGTKLGSCVPN